MNIPFYTFVERMNDEKIKEVVKNEGILILVKKENINTLIKVVENFKGYKFIVKKLDGGVLLNINNNIYLPKDVTSVFTGNELISTDVRMVKRFLKF